MDWMILPLKRYAEFGGRSRRKEYWLFFLFTVIVSAILGVIDTALGLTIGGGENTGAFRSNGVFGSIFSLATLVPGIAVGVRRLHDTDRSGWWLLLPIVVGIVAVILALFTVDSGSASGGLATGLVLAILAAVIGGVVLLIFFCLDGTRGSNRFGPDPKDPSDTANLGDVFA